MVSKTTSKRMPASRHKPPKATAARSVPPTAFHEKTAQQRLLNIFSDAFANVLSSESFPALLQEIKKALFGRDFAAAFGSEDHLEAYAARWSPTRALCYATVLLGIRKHVDGILPASGPDQDRHGQRGEEDESSRGKIETTTASPRLKMLSIGGCAAEHVAFAAYLRETGSQGTLTLLDAAPWSHVMSLLQSHLTSAPLLSNYASTAARASNEPFLSESQLSVAFSKVDALSLTKDKLVEMAGADPLIVTLLFTLNELYTDGGIGKTTALLRLLGDVLSQGSLLLVLDSPGSYSEAAVGKDKKRYPMQWLLNHTLLQTRTTGYEWEKLGSDDSIWFRLPEGLVYPMQLENMRYQMHLYRIHKT